MKNIVITIVVLIAIAFAGYMLYNQKEAQRTPTSADNAPPGSIHNLPVPEAVAKARALAAQELGTEEGLVIIQTALEKEWSDACLGLAKPDEMCAQVITPGYEVVVEGAGKALTYRTNADGSVIRKE